MAFVFKEERKIQVANVAATQENLGPGCYEAHEKAPIRENFAPFQTSATRNDKLLKKLKDQQLPGPGHYELKGLMEKEAEKDQLALALKMDNTFFRKKNTENAIFKSCNKRFRYKKRGSGNPGPAKYETYQDKLVITRKKFHQPVEFQRTVIKKNARQILDNIKLLRRYQSIPSIPSQKHTYGYQIQPDGKELVLNVRSTAHSTEFDRAKGNRLVGPGKYYIPREFEKYERKGYSWHKSKVARIKKTLERASGELGPGCYNVAMKTMPLYKYKSSPMFNSKTNRPSMNLKIKNSVMRKTLDAQNKLREKYYEIYHPNKKQQSYVDSDKSYSSSEDNDEFIADATPGPGSYLTEKNFSTFHNAIPDKNLHFGSKQIRFHQPQSRKQYVVGVGKYNLRGTFRNKDIRLKKIPFNSSVPRKEKRSKELLPGPADYKLKNEIHDNVIQKTKKGYKGSFGTHVRRFKYIEEEDEDEIIPGPGAYDDKRLVNLQRKQRDKGSKPFKDQQKREIFKKGKDKKPAVGMYDLNHHTIDNRVSQQVEIDPDLVIEKPGFNSGVERFNEVKIPKKGFIPLEEKELQILQKRKDELVIPNKFPFNKASLRFNKTQLANAPDPGKYYNPAEDPWDKRTFNILFADI